MYFVFYFIIFYFVLELINLFYYLRIKKKILSKNYYYGERIEKSMIKDLYKRNLIDFFKEFVIVDDKDKDLILNKITHLTMIKLILSYLFNKSLSQANYLNLKTAYYCTFKLRHKYGIVLNNNKYDSNLDNFMRFGKNSITSYYKPLFINFLAYSIRLISELILVYNGFKTYYSSTTNLIYLYKVKEESSKIPIMFIHGFGIGIIPYIRNIIRLSKETTIICPILPNISNVYFHPLKWNISKNDFFPELNILFQEFDEILENHKLTNINIMAHSFGTFILSGLMLNSSLRKKINKKIFIDPVCFSSDSYKIYRSVDVMKDEGKGCLKKLKKYLIYYVIYLDVYLKYATKRNLFSMDYLWGNYRYIDKNTIVVLSELDNITPSESIYTDMIKSGKIKNIVFLKNAYHGDLFMDNKYFKELNKINKYLIS
jgi:hypothetical protein